MVRAGLPCTRAEERGVAFHLIDERAERGNESLLIESWTMAK